MPTAQVHTSKFLKTTAEAKKFICPRSNKTLALLWKVSRKLDETYVTVTAAAVEEVVGDTVVVAVMSVVVAVFGGKDARDNVGPAVVTLDAGAEVFPPAVVTAACDRAILDSPPVPVAA